MDFSDIDNIITRLEKKKSLRPGSPPVVLHGNLGLWRTVRGFRMFIEVDSNGKARGKVLVGPPSFVGNKIGGVDDGAWENLTPRATLKQFKNTKVSDNGIATLKQSIKNAVAPDDSRRNDVDGFDTALQLVPIARSAGFGDDEIKSALAGNSPNKPLSDGAAPDAPKGDVDAPKAPETPEAPKDEEEDKDDKPVDILMPPGSKAPKTPEKPKKDESTRSSDDVEGALALALQATPDPGESSTRFLIDTLKKIVADKRIKDDLVRKQVEKAALGLENGSYSISDVKDFLQDVMRNRKRAQQNVPTDQQMDQMRDSSKVKSFIEHFDAKVQEKVDAAVEEAGKKFRPEEVPETETEGLPEELRRIIEEGRKDAEAAKREAEADRKRVEAAREAAQAARRQAEEAMTAAQMERIQIDAAVALLQDLAAQIQNPEVKKKVEELASNLKTSPFNRRSIFLRLYQLFQLLLLFIPL